MRQTDALVAELEATYHGEPWHGPSLKTVLQGITPEIAATRPPGHGHSIWELLLHVRGWMDVVAIRLSGNRKSEPDGGDFPHPPEPTDKSWESAKADLSGSIEKLAAAISQLSPEDLGNEAPGGQYTMVETIRGIIWHNVYHTGQISILKRIIAGDK